ncbi:unnamed protein product [Ectocarpus sp. CCAP 1310/34]|nr:unnamed protein product [Ectocarpus sp. CCAP 1310/34]
MFHRAFRRLDRTQPQSGNSGEVPGTAKEGNTTLKVATLNINGVKSKKIQLQRVLAMYRINCIALQETTLTVTDWALNVPGYRTFAVYGERTSSTRGAAILLRNKMGAQTVGKSSPWHTFVRCYGLGKVPLRTVRNQMRDLRVKYPNDSIILMGDFNRLRPRVEQWFNCAYESIRVWELTGKDADLGTRDHGSKRVIDHIMTSLAHPQDTLRAPRVLRKVDISDHYPVVSTFRSDRADASTGDSVGVPINARTIQRGERINTGLIPMPGTHWYQESGPRGRANHQKVIHANYWEPLADLIEEGNEELSPEDTTALVDAAASRMVEASHQVARECGQTKDSSTQRAPALKPQIARAIDDRGRLYRAAKRLRKNSPRAKVAWERYHEARMKAERLVRKDRRRAWTKALCTASEQLRSDPKAAWHFMSAVAGWKRKDSSGGLQPVQHPDSRALLTSANDISAAWRTHYQRLAADVTGNSRKSDKWNAWRAAPQRRHMTELDGPILREEMVEALARIKRHKSPGNDGVPADFLELAGGEEGSQSPMGKTVLGMLNLIWKTRVIPTDRRESTVVPIPKKGDMTDMNNHRGISLMNTVLKVLVMIISTRLNSAFERHKLFSQSQAGFRTREECVTQAACLLEICQRRKFRRKSAYLMFVDLKKAYDTVPQEALFAKLVFYGVRGEMLAFIRALYANSKIAVRTGDLLSDSFSLERGVRQGCPLSPVLFNIFINDILDGAESLGVPEVGNQLERAPRIPGLLFADDLVTISPTRAKLAAMDDHISVWMAENEMSAGIHKCGVMAIGHGRRRLRERPDRWKLAGETLPIVESYTYLGLEFNRRLDVEVMMGNKLAAGEKLVTLMTPYLLCRQIPVPLKVAVVRGVILPRLLFGAEVFGMRTSITNRLQVYVNRAYRMVAGMSPKATVSSVALWRELEIPPICASAAARRARTMQKASKLKTWIASIMAQPYKHRKWTWGTGTGRWMNRYSHRLAKATSDDLPAKMRRPGGWIKMNPQELSRCITAVVWEREERVAWSKTADDYKQMHFETNPLAAARAAGHATLEEGLALIIRCRVGGFWGAGRLSRRGMIHPRYKRMCPCCKRRVEEDLAHVLFDCPTWSEARNGLLAPLIAAANAIVGSADSGYGKKKVALLLGGKYEGCKALKDWGLESGFRGPISPVEKEG